MKPQERRGRAVVVMESEDNENEEKNNNIEMSEIEKQGKTETSGVKDWVRNKGRFLEWQEKLVATKTVDKKHRIKVRNTKSKVFLLELCEGATKMLKY